MSSRGHWRGQDNTGYNGRRGGSQSSRPNQRVNKPCSFFQRGRCTYGAGCKFLHESACASDPVLESDPSDDERQHAKERYFDWKRNLRKSRFGLGQSSKSPTQISLLWDGALAILASDHQEHHQLLAKDLASDELEGHSYIIATTSLSSQDSPSFVSYVVSFLRVITHPSLLNCLSIESFIDTVYRTFGGVNGDRAVKLLNNVCQDLMEDVESLGSAASDTSDIAGVLMKALYELLSRDRRAQLHDELPILLDLLAALIRMMAAEFSRADLDLLETRLGILQRLVRNATSQVEQSRVSGESPDAYQTIISTFPMDIHVPGGKHDNDHADISNIQIFPTYQEIMDINPEFLPSTNFLQGSFIEDIVQRHVDTTFRLLRHDIFGSAKDVLRELMNQRSASHHTSTLSGKDTRAYLYQRSNIQNIFINGKNELQAIVSFAAPPHIHKKSLSDQRRWWQESSRFEEGSLICFVVSSGSTEGLLFLQVTARSVTKGSQDQNKSALVSENHLPSITVKLARCSQHDLNLLCLYYRQKAQGLLVQFHGLIPATFAPILKNLQRMHRRGDLAFRQWILPVDPGQGDGAIPPPMYARKPGFVFPLRTITKHQGFGASLNPNTSLGSDDYARLEILTGLDRGQCQGLAAALSREYALIQGPPGTGKSYLGVQLVRTLLDVRQNAELGPILVICYTNHALDQFLKHLLDVGIEKIIRIGGRSQLDELEGKNLRVVSKQIGKTGLESYSVGRGFGDIEQCMKLAASAIKPLHKSRKGPTWDGLRSFLRREHSSIHRQLNPVGDDGFETAVKDPLKAWLGKQPSSAILFEKKEAAGDDVYINGLTRAAERDIYSLTSVQRWLLVGKWMSQQAEHQSSLLFEAVEEAERLREGIDKAHEEINRRALVQAHVVGITTTSLAKNIETLQRIGAKVIICEEAAEVMEAHVMSALMPGVEHFIQIGDHRQLRPQIQTYSLSLETASGVAWQLDRSQFERRAVGEPGLRPAPVAQLDVQRRMRPEISSLIRRVYPNLKDHESVADLPNVVGMRDNVFWLDHDCDEDATNDGARVKSHSNSWEVDMATALVRHLVRQGVYSSSDIALLTPYTGQLQSLRAALSKDFEVCLSERDVETLAAEGFETHAEEPGNHRMEKKQLLQTLRLATVDNFQGEEAKVIVVSLVRSNPARKVGFLRTENRINVLLSRAQHGMYLIGNTATYLHVPMWADVYAQLAQRGAVGTELALCCPRHPETAIPCSEPSDFERKSPEGGCNLPCTQRLDPCGHRCQAPCHSAVMHEGFACCQPCPRIRMACNHPCPKMCGEACGPCKVEVYDVVLPCGHTKGRLFCYQTLDLASIKCEAVVSKLVPGCQHSVLIGCSRDVNSDAFRCPEPCSTILGCGHTCSGSCGRCRRLNELNEIVFEHQACKVRCNRPYGTCNHRCRKPCHGKNSCGNCEEQCEVRCSHSACGSSCSKPCAPCIEKCTWSCPHQGSCTMPCAAPCDRLPCDERCSRLLNCGHQCPSFCGEICPSSLCQLCGNSGDARVDLLEFKSYSEIDLDETPIVVLGCGHFFTGETLDGMVGLHEVYTLDKAGRFIGLRSGSASLASTVPSCPDCKRPIRQFATKRYNRVINRAVMDETCKRFLAHGRSELDGLEERLQIIQDDKDQQKKDNHVSNHSATRLALCERDAVNLSKRMTAEHQPTKRLVDAITLAQLRFKDRTLVERMEKLGIASSPVFDSRVTLGASLIQIKAREIMISDDFTDLHVNSRITTNSVLPKQELHKSASRLIRDCQNLISEGQEAKLSRIVISATLTLAKIAELDRWYVSAYLGQSATHGSGQKDDQSIEIHTDTIRHLLDTALQLCEGLGNSDDLYEKVCDMIRLYEGPRYEVVTPEELALIKVAMVGGRGGIATHAGHWYNCTNGHPFAIGECGMPMEEAQCPECGARIGGQNHQLAQGVSRAGNMEQ